MTTHEPSEEATDKALLAGRAIYRAGYQLTHDPKVARMIDDAVEAGLLAAAPTMAAEVLQEAAEVFGTGAWLDAFMEAQVHNDVTAVQATCQWLQERSGISSGARTEVAQTKYSLIVIDQSTVIDNSTHATKVARLIAFVDILQERYAMVAEMFEDEINQATAGISRTGTEVAFDTIAGFFSEEPLTFYRHEKL